MKRFLLLVFLFFYFVSCAGNVFPETLALDKESVELEIGESEQLIATIEPENVTDKTITWISGNDDVIRIDSDGKLTALQEGDCNIIAVCMGVVATCKASVKKLPTTTPNGIRLNHSTLDMKKGEQELLVADVDIPGDDKRIIFLSSNTQCVDVDSDGKMTALDEGDATITVSTLDGEFTAECNVNVRIAVNKITISESELSFRGYQEKSLQATIYPEDATIKDVLWSSSDSDVVQVDSQGNLRAIAIGEAVITATAKDGLLTASCQCVVQRVPAESLYIGEGTIIDVAHNQKIQLPAVIVPSDSTDTEIEWQSNNPDAVEINNGLLTIKKPGNVTIFAQIKNTTIIQSREVYIPSALKFESDSSFTITSNNGDGGKTWSDSGVLSYTTNPTNQWTEWNGNAIFSSAQTDGKHVLYICGTNNTSITNGKQWVINGSNVSCYGDIRSLLNAIDVEGTTMSDNCFKYLFKGNESLILPPSLPATTLSEFCYNQMFQGCTSLKTAPALPATTLKKGCYISMFSGCTSLASVPALPATTLADNCYGSMFENCSLLKFSSTKTGEYANEFKISSKGTAKHPFDYMFSGTGGSFTGDPSSSGQTLWTCNEVVI